MYVERRVGSSRFTVDSARFPRRTKPGDDFLFAFVSSYFSKLRNGRRRPKSIRSTINSVGWLNGRASASYKGPLGVHSRIERKVVGSSPMLIVFLAFCGLNAGQSIGVIGQKCQTDPDEAFDHIEECIRLLVVEI